MPKAESMNYNAIPMQCSQIINVHPAPCHSPPIKKYLPIGLYIFLNSLLFPTEGI